MRLAALKNLVSGGAGTDKPEYEKLFNLAEVLAISLIGILVMATKNDELVWEYDGLNVFSAEFNGVNFCWDQPNNEPAYLLIEGTPIQDNGSGAYGFTELSEAIHEQKKD